MGRAARTRPRVHRKFCGTEGAAVNRTKKQTCAASCYEVGPGVWIHRPWDGCTTPMPEIPWPERTNAPCWHCGGDGVCDCISCFSVGAEYPKRARECTVCAWNALPDEEKQRLLDILGPKGAEARRLWQVCPKCGSGLITEIVQQKHCNACGVDGASRHMLQVSEAGAEKLLAQ